MAQPDLVAIILASDKGAPVTNNTELSGLGQYTYDMEFKYMVMNLSDTPSGKFTWVGVMYKNGEKTLVVPAEQIELQPYQVLVKTYTNKGLVWKGGHVSFEAKVLVDVGNSVNEASETNNKAIFKFDIWTVPW